MHMLEKESLELSVVMPCYNEEATVAFCVDEALEFLRRNRIEGEVVVADNVSTDDSVRIAREHGARIVTEDKKGYGNAVRTGIVHCRGRVIIIGDCDTTYDFLHLEKMYELLAGEHYDMVIGNRYAGGMEKGSMSWSHRWGVRFLSYCARKRFRTDVQDFHCGLRGLTYRAAKQLDVRTQGMEYATEMIAKAVSAHLRIGQMPVCLRKCEYRRESKLRTIRDGVRHLVYIMKEIS